MTDTEIVDLYDGFLNTPRAAGVLRHIMNGVDLTGFSPTGRAPRTAGRAVMVASGLGPWETALAEAMVNCRAPFDRDVFTLESAQDILRNKGAPPLRRLASILKKPPFNCTPLRTGSARVYCWRNQDRWDVAGAGAGIRHVETGVYPDGSWSREVPLAIRLLAGDDDAPDPINDLLGNVNG